MEYNGTYIECDLVHVSTVDNIKYGWIPKLDVYCIYISTKSLLPVIVDQIKPLFKLNKLGCRYNDKYIIYTPCMIDDTWAEELRLSNYRGDLTEKQVNEIRRILVFRYILGLPSINTKSILLRGKRLYDYGNTTIKFLDQDRYLSKNLYEKWFKEVKMTSILKDILKVGEEFNQIEDILEIRIKIERIIKKIDKKHLNIVSLIIDRISIILDTDL